MSSLLTDLFLRRGPWSGRAKRLAFRGLLALLAAASFAEIVAAPGIIVRGNLQQSPPADQGAHLQPVPPHDSVAGDAGGTPQHPAIQLAQAVLVGKEDRERQAAERHAASVRALRRSVEPRLRSLSDGIAKIASARQSLPVAIRAELGVDVDAETGRPKVPPSPAFDRLLTAEPTAAEAWASARSTLGRAASSLADLRAAYEEIRLRLQDGVPDGGDVSRLDTLINTTDQLTARLARARREVEHLGLLLKAQEFSGSSH